MDPQLPPSRKMIVENLDESTLTRKGPTSHTEVLVSKPRTGFIKEYVAVADRAVPSIYSPPAPLNRQENSTSDLTGNLLDHHRSQYAMARFALFDLRFLGGYILHNHSESRSRCVQLEPDANAGSPGLGVAQPLQ
jgi:hypothetical protein